MFPRDIIDRSDDMFRHGWILGGGRLIDQSNGQTRMDARHPRRTYGKNFQEPFVQFGLMVKGQVECWRQHAMPLHRLQPSRPLLKSSSCTTKLCTVNNSRVPQAQVFENNYIPIYAHDSVTLDGDS